MNNYHYIIAGLPDLVLDFDSTPQKFDHIIEHIHFSFTNPKERRAIEWLQFGLKEENLNHHFYRVIANSKIKFLREYFAFDLELRNIIAAHTSRKLSLATDSYLVGENQITDQLKNSKAADFALSHYSEIAPTLLKILSNTNILEREQQIDLLRWQKANEICTFNYFDINPILSFILKVSLVNRWTLLDKKIGIELFDQLVKEVKGSFKPDNNF